MNRKWIAALVLLLVIVIAGCGQKPQAAPKGSNESTNQVIQNPVAASPDAGSNGNPIVDASDDTNKGNAADDEIKQSIKVYFTDDNIMDLQAIDREISYVDESHKYEKAFAALQTPEEGTISLWQKVVLKSAAFSNGQVTLDITLPDEARLGAGGESLAIDALKQTMFQFDEVKQLELTVDGQQVDTLMGHVELEHPYNK